MKKWGRHRISLEPRRHFDLTKNGDSIEFRLNCVDFHDDMFGAKFGAVPDFSAPCRADTLIAALPISLLQRIPHLNP